MPFNIFPFEDSFGSFRSFRNPLLICGHCGAPTLRLHPFNDGRISLCTACYDKAEAATPTNPALPVVSPVPAADPDECQPEPVPGVTFCAAAYLAHLERSGMSFVPQGEPVLCTAHWIACCDDALRQYPSLICQPEKTPHITGELGMTYIRVAERRMARIAARLKHR